MAKLKYITVKLSKKLQTDVASIILKLIFKWFIKDGVSEQNYLRLWFMNYNGDVMPAIYP